MTITITCVVVKCVTWQCVFWLATALEERYIGAVHLHGWTRCFHPGWSCTRPAIPVLMPSVLSPASRAAEQDFSTRLWPVPGLCGASCSLAASLRSIKNMKEQARLKLPPGKHAALSRLSFFLSPPPLLRCCKKNKSVLFFLSQSLCRAWFFSHPACPSPSVSSWRFDSVTAVEKRLPVLWGRMSAGVRCLSWRRWLLCVWECVCECLCVCLCVFARALAWMCCSCESTFGVV